MRLSSHLVSDSFRASCRWINCEADSSDSDRIYSEWSLRSVEDQVDGLRETSKTIVSECNVTFELYRMYLCIYVFLISMYFLVWNPCSCDFLLTSLYINFNYNGYYSSLTYESLVFRYWTVNFLNLLMLYNRYWSVKRQMYIFSSAVYNCSMEDQDLLLTCTIVWQVDIQKQTCLMQFYL